MGSSANPRTQNCCEKSAEMSYTGGNLLVLKKFHLQKKFRFHICLLDPGALIIPLKGNDFYHQKSAKIGNSSSAHLTLSPTVAEQLAEKMKYDRLRQAEIDHLREVQEQNNAENRRKDDLLREKAVDGKQINLRLEIFLKS